MTKQKLKINNVPDQRAKKSKIAKEHLSSFLITINSNVNDRETYGPKLQAAFSDFYNDIDKYIINKGSTALKINKIQGEATIEDGKRRRASHLHALVKIYHTSKIHLNIAEMRKLFDERIKDNGKKVYFQCKYINDPAFNIRRYFEKEGIEDE